MNCPSHCVIFGSRRRSYRELPWRGLACDFGRLHRYERGGVVHGLARVRSFAQDDAHIFCAESDVAPEIARFMRFFQGVYKANSGSSRSTSSSRRAPTSCMGRDDLWDQRRRRLSPPANFEQAGLAFDLSPGEGAFYGPKIEFHVKDALKRSWAARDDAARPQPPREGAFRANAPMSARMARSTRPVMLHRAIFGSPRALLQRLPRALRRNFPTWIAPRQAIVLTVSDKADAYAKSVHEKLVARWAAGRHRRLGRQELGAKNLGTRASSAIRTSSSWAARRRRRSTVGVRSRDKGELGAMALSRSWPRRSWREGRPMSLGFLEGPGARCAPCRFSTAHRLMDR